MSADTLTGFIKNSSIYNVHTFVNPLDKKEYVDLNFIVNLFLSHMIEYEVESSDWYDYLDEDQELVAGDVFASVTFRLPIYCNIDNTKKDKSSKVSNNNKEKKLSQVVKVNKFVGLMDDLE